MKHILSSSSSHEPSEASSSSAIEDSTPAGAPAGDPTPAKVASSSWMDVEPSLLTECNALQLVELYVDHTNSSSNNSMNMDVVEKTVSEMINQLAQSKVVDSQHLADVIPLALLPLPDVIKSLLNALATKIRDSALLDIRLIIALTHVVKYANKDYLNASDILNSLDVIAVKLSSNKFQDGTSLTQCLYAMIELVDAAMMLNVRNLNENKFNQIFKCLDSMNLANEDEKVSREYIKQAMFRLTVQKADWETGMMATYSIFKGVIVMTVAVAEKSPTALLDAALAMYKDTKTLTGAIKGKMSPWFSHVCTLKLLAKNKDTDVVNSNNKDNDFEKFNSRLDELKKQKKMSKEIQLSLIPILDDIVRDKSDKRIVDVSISLNGKCSVQEECLLLLGKIYADGDNDVKSLILPKLFRCCTLPDINLQRAAKQVSLRIWNGLSLGKALIHGNTADPRHYWFSEMMLSEQVSNPQFDYSGRFYLGVPKVNRVAKAFESCEPIAFLIEGMHRKAYNFIATTLKQDLDTYIPVTTLKKNEDVKLKQEIRLSDSVCNFMNNKNEKVMIIQGKAGSGKSLFGRRLEASMWLAHQQGSGVIPLFVSLPAIKHVGTDVIREVLSEAGFTSTQIEQLRRSNDHHLFFILDGFDEITIHEKFYQNNAFSNWQHVKLIVSVRAEFIQAHGDYYKYFKDESTSSNDKESIKDAFISPFNESQQHDFFQKLIDNGQSTTFHKVSEYIDAIRSLGELKQLISTPYMLRMIAQVLPVLMQKQTESSSSSVTRADVYEEFTEQTFEKEMLKLHARVNQPNSTKVLPEGFDELASFRTFSIDLAASMFVNSQYSIHISGGNYQLMHQEINNWDTLFGTGDNPSQWYSIYGAPLVAIGNQRSFRHKSLMEYFVACMLIQELLDISRLLKIEAANQDQNKLLLSPKLFHSSLFHYFNGRSISEEPSVQQFMIDMLTSREVPLDETLWQVVAQSKVDSSSYCMWQCIIVVSSN